MSSGSSAAEDKPSLSLTHERMAALIPRNLDFVEAAAVPEAFITAHDALLLRGQLVPGERVLIRCRRKWRGHGRGSDRPRNGVHGLRYIADRGEA